MICRAVSRHEAEDNNLCSRAHIIISISTPAYEQAKVATNSHTKGVLRLQFHDLDEAPNPEWQANYGQPVLFGKEHAKRIKSFVIRYRPEEIIVHCDAGISRSPAVAAALSMYFNGEDYEFWCTGGMYNDRGYRPNQLVYKTLLAEMGVGTIADQLESEYNADLGGTNDSSHYRPRSPRSGRSWLE
jgi:predicted protein tyrosine phosphatase